jgi:signal transduction histidine kinase
MRRAVSRLGRWEPASLDRLAAAVLLFAIEAQIWLTPAQAGRTASAAGGVGVATAVAVRRRWPLGAVVLGLGSILVTDAVGGSVAQSAVAIVPAGAMITYGAGAFVTPRRALLGVALVVAGLALNVAFTSRAAADVFFSVVVVGVLPWALGWTLRRRARTAQAHRALAEQLDAERDLRARAAADDERARVARELHDVVAHCVSVMVIQAGGARLVMDAEPARAEESLRIVERAGREALAEMRRLLGVMDPGKDPAPLAPSPGIADVADLVTRTCDSGFPARLDVRGDPVPLTPALDLCAYRIVQEALTNAIKHAGPASVRVIVRWSAAALDVVVEDDGSGPPAGAGAAGGHGLAGMRERAALHGGRLDVGAGPAGGFIVHAHLPLETAPVA